MTKPGLLAWLNTPRGGVVMLIATTFLARLLFADWLGLGVDESYVVAAGRTLHLGYFDHPPLVWWLAWAGGHLPGQARDLLVRIPFILLFGVSTWLMFRLASELYDECAGLWSAAALNAAPVLGLTAGTWVLPDGPLIAALLGAALCLVRALSPSGIGWAWWLGTGLCFGFAALSKYTAAPVGIGVALYLLTQPQARHWLFRPQPYVAACLAAAMFVPVVVWNQQHGWASFRFQGGRADGGHWHPLGPFFTLAGEAIFLLPWLWGLLVICLWQAARRGPAEPRGWLLICLSLPTILLFELVSLRGHVLFHWAAPGTMLGLPLVGEVIGRLRARRRAIRVGLVATACFVTLGVLLVGTEVRFNWLPFIFEDFALGSDPDLEAVDWTSLRTEFLRRGLLHAGTVVAAVKWLDAGKIDFALNGEVPVICLGSDPREYGLVAPVAHYSGQDVLLVAPRETLATMRARFGKSFDSLESLPPVMVLHAGRPAMELAIFLGRRLNP